MSVKSPYLAAEHSVMDRRSRGLHRFLVSSPVLLLLAVGLIGHLKKAHHVGAAGTAEYDQNVLAYQGRVAAAEALLSRTGPPVDAILEEAGRWDAGFTSGQLKPLEPAAFEDHLNDGARGQVLRAGLGLSAELGLRAEAALRDGQPGRAAEEAMTSCESAYGLRGFELQAFVQSTMAVRRGVLVLSRAWPSLTSEEREGFRKRLRPLLAPLDEPEKLANTEKAQLKEYVQRQGREYLPPDVDPTKEDDTTDRQRMASDRSLADMNAKIQKLLQS